MIHFYYSENGTYDIQTLTDISESLIWDRYNNKVKLFGEEDFYFQTLSDICSVDASSSSVGFSQKGAYVMLDALQTDTSTKYDALNSSILATMDTLNSSINAVNTSVNTAINSINNSITTINSTIESTTSALNTSINNTRTYLNTSLSENVTRLNASINRVNTSTCNYFSAMNVSINEWVSLLDSSLSIAIEHHRITEEEWAGIFTFMDTSLNFTNTSVNTIERWFGNDPSVSYEQLIARIVALEQAQA